MNLHKLVYIIVYFCVYNSESSSELTLLGFPVLLLKLVQLQHQFLLLSLNLLLLSFDVLSSFSLFLQPLSAGRTQSSLPSRRIHVPEQTKTFLGFTHTLFPSKDWKSLMLSR